VPEPGALGSTQSRFLRAARRLPTDQTPVWLMRQAGRSLPEYRRLRERWTLLDIVAQPELCAEVTLQPVRRLGVARIRLRAGEKGQKFELGLGQFRSEAFGESP